MTKLRRNELEALSLKCYGAKSRYHSIMCKGQRTIIAGVSRISFLSEEEVESQMLKILEGRSDKTIEQALADLTDRTGIEKV